jgi:DNA-binding response OmpR family regulator
VASGHCSAAAAAVDSATDRQPNCGLEPAEGAHDVAAARILVVEDDAAIAELIGLYLEREGLASTVAASAEAAEGALRREVFHLLILDINLPGRNGFEFLARFRAHHSTPVIIVSARDSDEDKVLGLGVGADDFVTKPFSPRVLLARVRTNLRYLHRGPSPALRTVRLGNYVVHLDEFLVTLDGAEITLAPKEFDLLSHLVCNAGRAFTPEELYATVWNNRYGDRSTVTVHVQRLRKKLHRPMVAGLIETVPRVGYRVRTGDVSFEA